MSLTPFPEDFQTALCIAAHPDDLEYGAAAAVAKWTDQGKTVTYLLATRGEAGIDGMSPEQAGPVREQEERDGAREVGVDVVEFLDFTDGVVEYGLPLRKEIAAEIRRRRPEVIVTVTHRERFPGGFTNQADHRAVGLAALDAAADAGNRWIFRELLDDGLEPWSGVRHVAFTASAEASHVIDVSDTFDRGVASLEAHRQYLSALDDDYPAPRELLQSMLGTADDPERGDYSLTVEVYDR